MVLRWFEKRRAEQASLVAAPPAPQVVEFSQPSLTRPISQACTAAQFTEFPHLYWCKQFREAVREHRKQWEFTYILQALATSGKLAPGLRGLGFGVGNEPLTAIFADRGVMVTATDLATEEAERIGWTKANQHAHSLTSLNDRGICEPEEFARLVQFRFVDMNAIPDDLQEFDFCWSACALEHVGSIELGLQFIKNTIDRLRPGGVAVHTTELNCNSDTETIETGGTVLFRKSDLRRVAEDLKREGHQIRMTFDLGDQPLDIFVDLPPYSGDRHLKLQIEKYVTTSFGLIIRKKEA